MTPKERYLAAVRGENRDRVPVTPIFMQWAAEHIGRTYREYYLDCRVMADSQFAVTEQFHLDQISSISDPWREASAYGMTFDWPDDGVGKPHAHFLQSPADVDNLERFDPMQRDRTRDRIEAVALYAEKRGQTHSVLGWVEGPVAEYADLRGVQDTMMDFLDAPEAFEKAAPILVDNAIEFARAQIERGAETVGVGDAAGSLIGPALYREHVLPWEKKLIDAIHELGAIVKLHICGNTFNIVEDMAATGADILDLDWMVPLAESRAKVGPEVCLAGNFDPSAILLRGTPEAVADAARKCIADGGDRFLLQPGCEVPPKTPVENIAAFCPGGLLDDALQCATGA